ncbi:DoxX family protein [Enemella evansiae]|uniref:DoxX family protein n=1 Tax=Enemella evansiae TaxID=2016499 RepID=A0A255GJX8_9ACTN|nr:DoxX family protein [Enemella evansiae]PFG65859.1 putative oxidoreductase [Propionibacteriaceae bacterium ES.041]OYN98683.1 hypothetical protein CGZ95_12225 [Enemella evansiae]OYN98827.1 hypothetical protein CGZ97_20810 [Enemella evansiae]OYO03283.1 hypothetical protein CGZ96_01285 [Enemella evansiae]OYO13903.1 hypothetical protein CGZ98_04775 [Enemella evansiae]
MSVRETLPRSGSSAVEETQPLDLEGVDSQDERTARLDTGDERTQVQPVPAPPADAAERERRRREREKALGTRRKNTEPEPVAVAPKPKRTTDKFLGSLGLLLLRLVAAGIIGIHGYAKAMDIGSVQQMLNNTIIPEPVIMSYVLAASEVAIALALVLGLLTRLAGLGLAAIGIGALVFVKWVQNPFTGNTLSGELELLLGAVGLLFLCVGAGGASVDAAFRRRRAAAKA